MKNIALVLSYDGTNFNGWQIQKNGPSIQESMEDAIFHLLKQKVHVSGVGRTDSGVHARRYVANFHADCTIPMDLSLIHIFAAAAFSVYAVTQSEKVPEGAIGQADATTNIQIEGAFAFDISQILLAIGFAATAIALLLIIRTIHKNRLSLIHI